MKLTELAPKPFKKVGNHKGYSMRSLTPDEQIVFNKKVAVKPPKPSKEERQKALDAKLWKIYRIIEDEVSNSVPDGDPIDFVGPKVARFLGIDRYDVHPWLDKAVKKCGDYKNYDDYIAGMWDSYYEVTAETPEEYKEMVKDNPWR